MYENYYGLAEKPFSLLPDPEYLYLSRHHQKALTLLEYGILNQAGFCVISGQAGSGKTTLIRYLLNRFDKDTTVGLLSNTHESFEELLAWILMSFGLPYQDKNKTELYQLFTDFLIEQYSKKHHTVLIIDEAQNMSPAALEELRMLSNINADKDQLLQMILMGQPGLLRNLQRPELKQFAQRIAADYKLEAMNEDETCAYIGHRLRVAGAEADIFDESACKAVYFHSRGLPRLINLLCDTALVYGYAENIQVLDRRIIDDVIMERDANTILPHYHELNEEAVSAETEDEAKDCIAEKNTEHELSVESKMTSCGETTACDEKFSSPEVVASSDDSDSKADPGSGSVLPVRTASVTSLKQVEHFSKAMGLQKKTENCYQVEDSDKEDDDRNRAVSNVIPVNSDIKERLEDEPAADNPVAGNKNDRPVEAVSHRGTGKLGFIILGFAFGLLMSAAMLILSKMDNLTGPVVDESKIVGKMQEIENEFARKLQAIQQQREADLEKNRIMAQEKEVSRAQATALQRERDAALAIAKAREELLQAKLKAERAAQNERLAREKASLAQKRAQAAELEAKLIQQREKEALSAVSMLRREGSAQAPVEKAASATIETVPEPFPIEEPTAEPAQMVFSAPDQEKQSENDEAGGFLSNPCEGPTAVFISTCKK